MELVIGVALLAALVWALFCIGRYGGAEGMLALSLLLSSCS